MPSLLLYGLLALAILGTLGGIGYKIRESGKDSERLVWQERAREQRAAEEQNISDAIKEREEALAHRRVVYRTITEVVNNEVAKVEYRNMCLPDLGLCLANAALSGKSADSCQSDKRLPSPDRPR